MRLTRNQKMLSGRLAKAITLMVLFAVFAAALTLSLFSLELKTEARAVFMQPAPAAAAAIVTNTNTPVLHTEPITAAAQLRTQARVDNPTAQAGSNAEQRAAAACEAGRNSEVEKIPTLIALLADDTKTELLRCWSTGRWSPALETFKHPSPGEQAAIALASMGRVALLPLTNQLDNSNATVRRNAAWAIGELTNMSPGERDDAVPRLMSLLSDPDSWVRMAAARALGEVRNRKAVQQLFVTLGDVEPRVRQMAVWALSELKDKRDVAPLCAVLLSDVNPEVRRAAAEALGEIRSADALPFLKQVLNDPVVRERAQWAISEIEGDE